MHWTPERRRRLLLASVALAGALFAVDWAAPSASGAGALYLMVLLLSLWHPERWSTWALAALCSALTILGALGAREMQSAEPLARAERLLTLCALWVAAVLCVRRKSAISALQRIERRVQRAVRAASDALWEWNPADDSLWLSPGWRRTLGTKDGELPRTFTGFQKLIHPHDREREAEQRRRHLETGAPYDVEYRLRTGKRAWRWFRSRGAAVPPEEAGALVIAGSVRDIHDRKIAQRKLWVLQQQLERRVQRRTRELEQANRELQESQQRMQRYVSELERQKRLVQEQTRDLERANTELEEFAYVASHDLQEPLRNLISFATLLEEDAGKGLPEAARQDLDFVRSAAHRMQQLVRDLLALSRAGRSAMRWETVDLNDCIDEALEALRTRIEETGARIERTPLPAVRGDRTLLRQVFQNLVGNALKFTRQSLPLVRFTAEDDGETVVVGVADDGIGMKAEYAQQIFLPFQRLHGRQEYDGTGIGLTVCRKAIERHGGEIWVESAPGRGAHFKFRLRRADG